MFIGEKQTLDPKADINNTSLKKKIQTRTKQRSCFITACIHGTNEMEVLIKAKRWNGKIKSRDRCYQYIEIWIREQDNSTNEKNDRQWFHNR